jgi:hypothetical protein
VTAVLEQRVTRLEKKVERLETWAGPGQNVSFSESLAELRKKFDDFGKVQAKHTKMIDNLTADVATLKSDMVEVKGTLGEILDRLPPRRE